MDHEEMRNALDRAIETFKLDQCNNCGNPSDSNTGEFIDLILTHKIIRIWECSDCVASKETF